jgi:hypothetical protein
VWSPVATLADHTPRLYSSAAAIYAAHGYSQGLDYAAEHFQQTGKPVLFVPVPIVTAGVVGRQNSSGNTGSSVITVAAGGSGSLEECDGIVEVVTGGTIGTDQIVFKLSMDGGFNWKTVKLGTANSYAIPYVGQTLSFAPGNLVAGDTAFTWHSTAPKTDSTAVATAKTKLAQQSKRCRNWLVCNEVSVANDVTPFKTAVDGYETANNRYERLYLPLRDALPVASLAQSRVRMTGSPNITFAEVGATGDTITRSSGSFIADGFVAGDTIRVTGAVASAGANNVTGVVANVAATILTLDTTDLVNEGPIAGVSITSEPTLTFAEVGASADTITRSRGSWLDDGFRSTDTITITGTASNNVSGATVTVTALVITMGTTDLAAEVIGSYGVSIVTGETDAQCIASLDAAMASVTSDHRVALGYGRGAMLSTITGWKLRRNSSWHNLLRAYQNDIRTTTWWNALGSLDNCDLNDVDGNPKEHDERTTEGAISAGFVCLRTFDSAGAYIAKDLTRADSNSVLSLGHNADVTNLAQSVVQQTTEKFVGQVLILNPADTLGKRTATSASLKELESKVNSEVQRYLLSNIGGQGQRASNAVWTAATDDDLGVADATLHGTLALELNGTITTVDTTVKVS